MYSRRCIEDNNSTSEDSQNVLIKISIMFKVRLIFFISSFRIMGMASVQNSKAHEFFLVIRSQYTFIGSENKKEELKEQKPLGLLVFKYSLSRIGMFFKGHILTSVIFTVTHINCLPGFP